MACGLGCSRFPNPQVSFQRAEQSLRNGDLTGAQQQAEQGYRRWRTSSPEWSRRFRILEAEAALLRGLFPEALKLLNAESSSPESKRSNIKVLALKSAAHARLHQFDEAEKSLQEAEVLCRAPIEVECGEVLRSRGVLAVQRGQPAKAKKCFEQTLVFARDHEDQFLEATALLNLGLGAVQEQHFDEAIDWTDAAYKAASALDAGTIATKALGNLGWAYYNLGDSEKSLQLSHDAEQRAIQVGDVIDRLSWLTNAGYVYQQMHDLARAKQCYLDALTLAKQTNGRGDIYNGLRALALVSVQNGEVEAAKTYANEALALARADNNRLEELYPLLVNALIAAHSHEETEAEHKFREVESDPVSSASLRWRAEHGLGRLFEDEKRPDDADREYRAALATFEAARFSLHSKDALLPFSTNAITIYDDYVHFLVARGKTNDALRWAEHSRARSLAEGLRLLPNGAAGPMPLNVHGVAERVKGTLLFYWLGEKRSYLWAITRRKVTLFPLPAGSEIGAAVERYRLALTGPQDVLESANLDGSFLYRTLVAPAQDWLPKDGRVFIIPDGPLNNLNFETLLVPEPTPHYWIQDVTVSNASSLRMLAAAHRGEKKQLHNLLLIGNSVPASEKYPALPRAGAQMESVAKHFSLGRQKILAGEQATPAAYLGINPEQYSFIHFVAHGTASRLSPLDSAIVLSKTSGADDSFKLYARDIMQHPLKADLVTISACYGSGERSYAGEGLVGLSWAFLESGAHNVIAALWEATDTSTEQLMATLYDELDKGAPLDAALRTAKLSLLQGRFRNPFYWAPFQLYTGS